MTIGSSQNRDPAPIGTKLLKAVRKPSVWLYERRTLVIILDLMAFIKAWQLGIPNGVSAAFVVLRWAWH
jgi:hypothetical protein